MFYVHMLVLQNTVSCLSITCVYCDKTNGPTAHNLIVQYLKVLFYRQWLVRDVAFRLNLAQTDLRLQKNVKFDRFC